MTLFAIHLQRESFGGSIMFEFPRLRLTFETLKPRLKRWRISTFRARYRRDFHLFTPFGVIALEVWIRERID